MGRRPTGTVGAAALSVTLAVAATQLAAPADAQAQIGLPLPPIPNPFDIGLPGPSDLIANVFRFFFETFFGIEARVTRRVVEWLLAIPTGRRKPSSTSCAPI